MSRPRSYRAGASIPGRVGPTWDESEAAYPIAPRAPEAAPNVCVIVLDDCGYGWAEPFGGLVETPTMMALAEAGLRYTNFHTTPLCSPTRACVLSGRNCHSVGMGTVADF